MGEDRDEERERRVGEVCGEGEKDGVVGGVGIVSLCRSGIEEVDESSDDGPGLMTVRDDELSFKVGEVPEGEGSMAKNTNKTHFKLSHNHNELQV